MVCPPAIGIPAVLQTDAPPAKILPMVPVDSTLIGIPTKAKAKIGFPPMAYTSLIALVAAMRPKS